MIDLLTLSFVFVAVVVCLALAMDYFIGGDDV